MNKNEFILELRNRLKRLPDDEIENAVSYYDEYFNDAGTQNEQQTIKSLGSPSAVASKIIGEYALSNTKKEHHGKNNLLLITILAVCASPIALPIALSIIALIISIGIVFLSIGFSAIAIVLAGVVCAIAGLWAFSHNFATGIFYLGIGLFSIAFGIAMTVMSIKLTQLVFRSLQKWLGKLLIRSGAK